MAPGTRRVVRRVRREVGDELRAPVARDEDRRLRRGERDDLHHVDVARQHRLHVGREQHVGHDRVEHRLQRGIARLRLRLAVRVVAEDRLVVHEEGVGAGRAERERLRELLRVQLELGVRGLERLVADDRRVEHDEHHVVVERDAVGLAVVADAVVRRIVAVPLRRERTRVEQPPPPLPAAIAGFVIATHEDPRRRREQCLPGREEIRFPTRPGKAIRAARAAGVAGWTGRLAVVVVADVDHDVGRLRGGELGQRAKRPLLRIVARLEQALVAVRLHPAAGVADQQDLLRMAFRQRQLACADRRTHRFGRQRRLADRHREDGRERVVLVEGRRSRRQDRRRGAQRHLHGRPAVDDDRRARAGDGDRARDRLSVLAEQHVRVTNVRRRRNRGVVGSEAGGQQAGRGDHREPATRGHARGAARNQSGERCFGHRQAPVG